MQHYFTTGEAARICGVNLNTIKRWIKLGALSAVRTPGGHWRIPAAELRRFLRRHGMSMPVRRKEGETRRILVVDDDPVVLDFVRSALELMPVDCEIHSAPDGYSGMLQLGLIRPHLLILDIMMPGVNGLEFIYRLRAQPKLGETVRILALTGARDRRLVMRKLKEAGPDAILLKPVSVETLQQAVFELLQEGTAGGVGRRS